MTTDRTNRFPATCACGARCEPGRGRLISNPPRGKSRVRCVECDLKTEEEARRLTDEVLKRRPPQF